MKSKKWMENRKGPSSRLIVDQYDLIKKQQKQQHTLCRFCQQHIPQRLIVSHQNVCMMAENQEYYARAKSQNECHPQQKQHQENNRKKIGTKINKNCKRTSSNASIHRLSKTKKNQNLDFVQNPSIFSQKSTIKNNKNISNGSTHLKCNSVRKISNQCLKKPVVPNQSVRIGLSKSKGQQKQKLRKKTYQSKEGYFGQLAKNLQKNKNEINLKRRRQIETEKRQKREEREREIKRQKELQKKRKERERQREIERERQRKQQQRRNREAQRRRRNNRHHRPRQHRRRQEFFQEESFQQNFSQFPQQNFQFITQTMNEQFEMMRQQFQHMSNFFNNFQGFQSNNGFVFYHSNVSDSSQDVMYYEEDGQEEEEEEEQGLVEEEIQMIPKFKYKKRPGIDEQCTVCLNNLRANENVRSLPCQHIFHCDCIDEWLQRKAACPVCREDIKNLLM